MKISAKTLAAARRAAKARGMSLDNWAEQVLTEAAATSNQPSMIEAQLNKISEKLDLFIDRQGLAEKASELLERARKSASDFIGPITLKPEQEKDSSVKPIKRKTSRKPSQSRTGKGAKAAGSARRRPASDRKTKSEKQRGSQRRRSQPKTRT